MSKSYSKIKRLLDILLSFLLIVFCFIPMVLISLWIFLVSPGKVFFSQKRYGYGGKPFSCFKFRTMKRSAPHDVPARSIPEVWSYFIPGGGFLRKSGLDELPQLFNILAGKMSFVGPRPCMLSESALYQQRLSLGVFKVRPGLTGYAQTNNRSLTDDNVKATLDAYYVQHMNFSFDAKLFFKTFAVVFSHSSRKKKK